MENCVEHTFVACGTVAAVAPDEERGGARHPAASGR